MHRDLRFQLASHMFTNMVAQCLLSCWQLHAVNQGHNGLQDTRGWQALGQRLRDLGGRQRTSFTTQPRPGWKHGSGGCSGTGHYPATRKGDGWLVDRGYTAQAGGSVAGI